MRILHFGLGDLAIGAAASARREPRQGGGSEVGAGAGAAAAAKAREHGAGGESSTVASIRLQKALVMCGSKAKKGLFYMIIRLNKGLFYVLALLKGA